MLFVKKLDPRATLPTCAHPGEDLAYDLYALEDTALIPTYVNKVRTGIAVEHRRALGHCGLLIRDRSSMASKGVFTHGGVIDSGYRGEIVVLLTVLQCYDIKAGDKIAQMVPVPVLTNGGVLLVDELTPMLRDMNGFGSTGR